ncbi:MAG: 5'-methylthioadenosine/adenosylhomocysteine nucleosidase [Erysipelotrichaceae bacterium]|jgi:adenosylhomocysteine nucleosidase|nr:5'-methylthioadenosine/adenosylhomocysteine nucleosidase [Erysipelotrichaceae bacterium]
MIGIIGAMEAEVKEIRDLMTETSLEEYRSIPFVKGKLSGKDVILMQSGVGKVLAAMSTTVLLEHYDIDFVINIGTAGGLLVEQEVLDAVFATKIGQFDKRFGPTHTPSYDDEVVTVVCDPDLVSKARECFAAPENKVWIGPMVTSDQFVYNQQQLKVIEEFFPGALCADMESGAIGAVCTFYHKPFVVLRSLSDIAVKEGNELTFMDYLPKASKRSAKWAKEFLSKL